MLIGMVFETLGVGLVVPVIALLMQDDIAIRYPAVQPVLRALGNPSAQKLAAEAMIGFVGIYLVKNIFLGILTWRKNRFAVGLMTQISQNLLTLYFQQPYAFHLQRNSAHLIRNITNEIDLLISNVITPFMQLIAEALILLGILGLLFTMEPVGAGTVIIVIVAAAVGFGALTRGYVNRWGVARQFHAGLRLQHIQQGLGGVKDIKLLGREHDFLYQYDYHNRRYARVVMFQNTLLQIPALWLELLSVAGLAGLVLIMVVQGRQMASIVPTLGLFAAAAFRLMPSINRVLGAVQSLRYGLPVVNALYEELSLTPLRVEIKDKNLFGVFQTKIEISNLNYAYPGAPTKALEGLSLVIQKGESVGFIGPSGSGKSTLVDVILGLLAPSAGQVIVDGQDIQRNLRAWQDQIGYVPQSIYLTDDTLRRNVAFGLSDKEIDQAAVHRALQAAQLDDFVASLPDGQETLVGERGVRLSGGQRQRIGIARALYHDPGILVLDEATSALDLATEQGVMRAVNALHGAKTILIVAHRLSTVEHCDRLYRLHEGKLVEEGTSQTMLAKQFWGNHVQR